MEFFYTDLFLECYLDKKNVVVCFGEGSVSKTREIESLSFPSQLGLSGLDGKTITLHYKSNHLIQKNRLQEPLKL